MADTVIFAPTLAEAFERSGLPFPGEPEPGKVRRFSTRPNDRSDRAGWARMLPDGAACAFGDWREGCSYLWQQRDTDAPPPTKAERTAAARKHAEAALAAETLRERDYAQAAAEAAALWATLEPCPDTHRYAVSKNIIPEGARIDAEGRMVLPVLDDGGRIQSLQSIAADGTKRFHPGGRMAAGRLFLGTPAKGEPIILAEGYATACSIRAATGQTVCVAFSGGNMARVAADLRKRIGMGALLIAGDLDQHGKGAEYAQAAAEAGAPAIVVLPVFRDGRPAGDFNDLAQAEGAETVRQQIADALNPPELPFPFTLASDLLNGPTASRWLLRGWIECGSLALLFGESTAGKSFVCLDWAACIATGTPWNGCTVRPGPVFYIAGEGKAGISTRLAAWQAHTGVPLADAPLHLSDRGAALLDASEAHAIGQTVQMLSQAHGKPAMVVVDTLHRNMGQGDENSAEDISALLANLDRAIREPLGCAVLLVHHSGHGDKGRGRGSSAIRAALDSEFSLTLDGRLRTLACTKMKDAEPPATVTLDAQTVTLTAPWVDDAGEAMSSLVLVPTEERESERSKGKVPTSGNQAIVWRELGPLFCASQSLGQGGAPPSRPCIRFEDAVEAIRGKLPVESRRQGERAKQAIAGLVGRGVLGFGEDWLWCI